MVSCIIHRSAICRLRFRALYVGCRVYIHIYIYMTLILYICIYRTGVCACVGKKEGRNMEEIAVLHKCYWNYGALERPPSCQE